MHYIVTLQIHHQFLKENCCSALASVQHEEWRLSANSFDLRGMIGALKTRVSANQPVYALCMNIDSKWS